MPRHKGAEITLLHLATHTSGLPRLPPGLFWHGLRHRDDPYARLTPAGALAALGRTRTRRAPGDQFKYSNFGAGVLGLALAHTAGVDYETLVRNRITRPLGMGDTVITLDAEQRSRLAPGTRRGGGTGGYRSFIGWTPTTHNGAVVLSSNVRSVDRVGSRVLLDLAATAHP